MDAQLWKVLGQLFGNPSNEIIIEVLSTEKMYAAEIAGEANLSIIIVNRLLEKMVKLGIVQVTLEPLVMREKFLHKYYKMINPNLKEELEQIIDDSRKI